MNSFQIAGGFHFGVFDRLVSDLGWQRDSDAVPVDPDEPAFASWSRDPDGQMEYVYNPALGLRALAVRGEDVEPYVDELAGLVALVPSPLTLEQWEQAWPPDARATALVLAEIVKAQVMPILAALRDDPDGAVARELEPRPADYSLVFVEAAVGAAWEAYGPLWAEIEAAWRPPAPEQRDILCFVAPAGMLASENELSRPFPGGYRAIAHLLVPSRVWVAWKYVLPGSTSGLAYNGLVWVDDHWAWFPKPYRVLHDRP